MADLVAVEAAVEAAADSRMTFLALLQIGGGIRKCFESPTIFNSFMAFFHNCLAQEESLRCLVKDDSPFKDDEMKLQSLTLTVCLTALLANGCATSGNSLGFVKQKAPQTDSVQFSVARAHEQEGNLSTALQIYESLYTANTSDPEVCHRLGVTKLRMGKISEGISYLMEADSLNPDNAEILGDIGYAHIQQGEFQLAEEFLRQSLDLNPVNERNVSNLAMAVGYQGRMDESYSIYRTVIGEAESFANLGFIHSQRGETDQSIEKYSKALDLDPGMRSAGEALVQMVDIDHKVELAKRQSKSSKIQLASDAYFE